MTADLIKGIGIGAILMTAITLGSLAILATAIWKDIR